MGFAVRLEPGKEDVRIIHSSGNVFADLGLPDPELLMAKAELTAEISVKIREMGLTLDTAVALTDLEPTDVSAILQGRLADYSVDRLMRVASAIRDYGEINIR